MGEAKRARFQAGFTLGASHKSSPPRVATGCVKKRDVSGGAGSVAWRHDVRTRCVTPGNATRTDLRTGHTTLTDACEP